MRGDGKRRVFEERDEKTKRSSKHKDNRSVKFDQYVFPWYWNYFYVYQKYACIGLAQFIVLLIMSLSLQVVISY